MKPRPGGRSRIQIPRGFEFAGGAAGIKRKGGLDLGLVEIPGGAAAAAVFTSNRVQAAPLQVGRRHLTQSRGRVRAVVVNSGNANCATGAGGIRACKRICARLAKLLQAARAEVFPSSTGVIGVPLPAEKILRALPGLVASREASARGLKRFARGILTTDSRPKLAGARLGRVSLLGVAKGAGMIHPRLATLLVYLFTDAAASPTQLRALLRPAVARTFNSISVDGDTSTNDTALLLASGRSGVRLRGRFRERFLRALIRVSESLALQIVSDGEGVRHVVRLQVQGARSEAEADRVARAIAHSPLVKTAWAGADPNWGRILAAIGSSGVLLDPNRVDIYLGRQRVCRRGAACRFDEARAHGYLSGPTFTVRVDLHRGRAATTFWTTDLTEAYVRVNASYRS